MPLAVIAVDDFSDLPRCMESSTLVERGKNQPLNVSYTFAHFTSLRGCTVARLVENRWVDLVVGLRPAAEWTYFGLSY